MVQLTYDGSYTGLMSVIFEVYERKLKEPLIVRKKISESLAFQDNINVASDEKKATRVLEGLQKKLSKEGLRNIYCSFLSEIKGIDNTILAFVQQTFAAAQNIESDFGNHNVLTIAQTAKSVDREKHRFEAFVRFENIGNELYYAPIDPKYNVLPLIIPHFKSRYAGQDWIIYDVQRKYGVHYQCATEQVNEVTLDFSIENGAEAKAGIVFDKDEKLYQELWKNYFKSTTIDTRKNMKLHMQHVPKRYWKYLVEKQ